MVSDYSGFNEETYGGEQKRFLQCNVPCYMVIALAVRFCNFTYTPSFVFEEVHYAIYNGLAVIYSDITNEAEISEMLNQSIEIIDPDQSMEYNSHWIVEPFLLCLETAEELKEEIFCSICLDNHAKINTVTTNCGHEFCKACLCSHLDHQIVDRIPTCPMCRATVRTLEIKDVDYYDEMYERYVTAPLAVTPANMPDDIDTVSDIAFLDSFDFMPEGVF
jgi:hypothetical protein